MSPARHEPGVQLWTLSCAMSCSAPYSAVRGDRARQQGAAASMLGACCDGVGLQLLYHACGGHVQPFGWGMSQACKGQPCPPFTSCM